MNVELTLPTTCSSVMQKDQIATWSNLHIAYRKAAKGKRGRAAASRFEYNLEHNLLTLQRDLTSHAYRPGRYHHFYIHEPKRRLISAAPFRDRVVHHTLCAIVEPRFEASFIHDSYANRVGKGTHRALDRAQSFARTSEFVLQCDVKQFFPSIDHEILQTALFAKVAEPELRWLIQLILKSGESVPHERFDMVYFPGDDLMAALRPRGLPIGNLTSQFWANVYMNGFDHFVKRELRCKKYVRFVDDFLLFSDDKVQLWHWKEAIDRRLASLRLVLHDGAHPRPTAEGFPFLGFHIFPDRRRLLNRKGYHFRRQLRRAVEAHRGGELSREDLDARIRGWVNHARYGNTVGLRKAVFNEVLMVN